MTVVELGLEYENHYKLTILGQNILNNNELR